MFIKGTVSRTTLAGKTFLKGLKKNSKSQNKTSRQQGIKIAFKRYLLNFPANNQHCCFSKYCTLNKRESSNISVRTMIQVKSCPGCRRLFVPWQVNHFFKCAIMSLVHMPFKNGDDHTPTLIQWDC